MKKIVTGLAVALCVVCVGVLVAQTDEQQTIAPEELAKDMGSYEGTEHSFKDVVGYIYKDLNEFPGYLKFDTYHVRCRVAVNDGEDRWLLKRWARGEIDKPEKMEFKDTNLQLIKDVYFSEIEPHPLAFSGKVVDCDPEKVEGGISFGYQYVFEVEKVERVTYQEEK